MPRIVDGKPVEENSTSTNETPQTGVRTTSVPLISDQSRYLLTGFFLLISFLFFGWKGLLISLGMYGVMYLLMNRMGPLTIGGLPTLPTTNDSSSRSSNRPSNNRPSNVRTMDDLPKDQTPS